MLLFGVTTRAQSRNMLHRCAVTRFWSTGMPELRPGVRLFLVKPETGRTHQIRVALKSNSAPILGDMLYANKDEAKTEERTYLHAAAIRVMLGTDVLQVSSRALRLQVAVFGRMPLCMRRRCIYLFSVVHLFLKTEGLQQGCGLGQVHGIV